MDALVLDTQAAHSNVALWPHDDLADVLQKLIYLATRTNVVKVWVQGIQVHGALA